MAVSLLVGVVTALVLVAFVVARADEHVTTGSEMVVFGIGWALLALLSIRLTDQPQRWALVPAACFLLIGARLLVLAPSSDTLTLNLSTNSAYRVLPDTTHTSLIQDESDAAAASQALLDTVESVRTGTPLAAP